MIYYSFTDKPSCAVTQSEDDDYILLTCVADANPSSVDFAWQRGGNETRTLGRDRFSVDGLSSTLRLDLSAASFGTYFCAANNSLGAGAACEIDVEGIGLLRAGSANIIVIVAIAAAGVVAILALIVLVILLCKRRRPKDQCKSDEPTNQGAIHVASRYKTRCVALRCTFPSSD